MRSLQDWMKYIEEQEQSVKDAPAEPLPEQEIVEPEIAPDDVPLPPTAQSPTVTSVTPVEEARPSAAVEEAARIKKKPTRKPAVRSPKAVTKPRRGTKESRRQLLERLLDPLISLEEAAKLLEVCPTTVRRYTNKGLLKHHRTAGNQRRFKLSDILGFLESSGQ